MEDLNVIVRTEYQYCLVGGEIVTYDEKTLYSTYCTCEDGKQGDCAHKVAVDRYFDAARMPVVQKVTLKTSVMPVPPTTVTARMYAAPLNNNNQGFSLLRR